MEKIIILTYRADVWKFKCKICTNVLKRKLCYHYAKITAHLIMDFCVKKRYNQTKISRLCNFGGIYEKIKSSTDIRHCAQTGNVGFALCVHGNAARADRIGGFA